MSPNTTPRAASTRPTPAARGSRSPGSAGWPAGAAGVGETVELLMDCLPWTDAPAADHCGEDAPRWSAAGALPQDCPSGPTLNPVGGGTRRTGGDPARPAAGRGGGRPPRPATPQRRPAAPQLPDDGGLAATERQGAPCRPAARAAEAVSPEVVLDAGELADQLAH